MSSINLRIEEAVRYSGMTAADVAREAGISKGYLNTIMNGESNPSYDIVERLNKVLHFLEPANWSLTSFEEGMLQAMRDKNWPEVLNKIALRMQD